MGAASGEDWDMPTRQVLGLKPGICLSDDCLQGDCLASCYSLVVDSQSGQPVDRRVVITETETRKSKSPRLSGAYRASSRIPSFFFLVLFLFALLLSSPQDIFAMAFQRE